MARSVFRLQQNDSVGDVGKVELVVLRKVSVRDLLLDDSWMPLSGVVPAVNNTGDGLGIHLDGPHLKRMLPLELSCLIACEVLRIHTGF